MASILGLAHWNIAWDHHLVWNHSSAETDSSCCQGDLALFPLYLIAYWPLLREHSQAEPTQRSLSVRSPFGIRQTINCSDGGVEEKPMNLIAVIAGASFAFAGATALAAPVTQGPGHSPQAQRWHQISGNVFKLTTTLKALHLSAGTNKPSSNKSPCRSRGCPKPVVTWSPPLHQLFRWPTRS